ncbi:MULTISPECIES: 30S ribosomal protein S16 [Thermovenabulum]|uniref:Small ribosomal subunit protein bS16 n=1 Tax=Thermovenabulum gondwanense TaxID=520767 RepID=A0A162MNF1_9FIRM|nr:30S ribosomal protein S16 [Thermovenabulum gondwanense]KYO66787.1 30S ribosomal protein S16 [Thermovenabulum gondwanense]
MAVRIRLRRMGAKKRPFYRIIVADSRSPRDGRFIEEIGYYNPLTDPAEIKINEEKALGWIKKGAQPTDTVKYLFKVTGLLDKIKSNKETTPQTPEVKEE